MREVWDAAFDSTMITDNELKVSFELSHTPAILPDRNLLYSGEYVSFP